MANRDKQATIIMNTHSTKELRKGFVKALTTIDFIYFINEKEADDNANTLMYDYQGNLISDNYLANQSLLEDIWNNKAIQIEPSFIVNYNEVIRSQDKEEPTQPGELNIVYVYELYLNFIEKLGYNKTSVTIEQLASIKSSFHNLLNEINIQKK